MITLRTMTPNEFEIFLENEINEYAQWIQRAYNLSKQNAHSSATQQLSLYKYKQGLETPDHKFYIIENDQQNKIGTVVYSFNRSDNSVWLDCIEIDPLHRGNGYGNTTLKTVTESLKKQGYHHITLQVYRENKVAQALYHKHGFEQISHVMVKTFE
ncbi:GNAT family N-acetyltransferase [Zooshikella harenae]|uniref:GNAT family N-acetyltransferase n=1 Tax=Zooshikella harenae TaxID=2827238 RepID=A0ABS5Z6E7_9GAMM|nr:GNAT family N-acetyltransferase [Zooshikella harenae]MBU2709624.1 GNAT family N-acetyltransferase [Zooshikella harenae]